MKGKQQTDTQITLRTITLTNWQECIQMQLPEEQARLVASNLYSLAEAYVQPELTPRAIYAGEQMIGFVMTHHLEAENYTWIPRFMIGRDYQGRGYGRAAMQHVIDVLKSERPETPILLSLIPANVAARNLYLSMGFEDTGEHTHGEDILQYA